MKIAFLMSLPRSGSTLLERILSTHPEIASVNSECWLMLQHFEFERYRRYSELSESFTRLAVDDFIASSIGVSEYTTMRTEFVHSVYNRVAEGSEVFLDKTPRYAPVAEEIYNLLPDEKYVVLVRNPLSICASMIETWGNPPGAWNLYSSEIDLCDGVDGLAALLRAGHENVIKIKYEDLVIDPLNSVVEIASFMLGHEVSTCELSFDLAANPRRGLLGDPNANKKYQKVDNGSLDAWQKVFCNSFRRRWAVYYLESKGECVWSDLGYSLDEMKSALAELKGNKNLVSDIARYCYGLMIKLGWKFSTWFLKKYEK